VLDRFGGDVEAGHGVAALGEADRVPPAAARDVDDPGTGREPEPFLDGWRAGSVWGTMWHGAFESDAFRRAWASDDLREGIAAFHERRAPEFRGE